VPPPKRVKQTDAIFEELKRVNPQADRAEDTLRVSIDAKATVNIGPFSRRGRSRTRTKAADHDFKPEATLTPFGIFLPQHDDLWLYMARSKVTSDFIVDRLEQWWQEVRLRFLSVKTLVINLDNGPENHSRRTQFLKRVVEFARKYGLAVRLASSPPYHSKYNPIERCWGILEMHWNGSLLDSIEAVVGFAGSMTWKGKHPVGGGVGRVYNKGGRRKPKRRKALGPEGDGWPELLAAAERLAASPFDRHRPPWEALLIEGLPDGRAAYLLKLHHVTTDGLGSVALFSGLLNRRRESDPDKPQPPPPDLAPDPQSPDQHQRPSDRRA